MAASTAQLDGLALQEFLIRDAGRLRRYVASKIPLELSSVASPDDVLQDVWITAFRGMRSFRADGPDSLARWVTTLTNRRLVDTIRAARALKRRGQCPDVRMADRQETSMLDLFDRVAPSKRTPSSEVSAKEVMHAVRVALAALPADRRRALWMTHIEGRSVEETARAMHKTVPAVRGLLFRGRKQLGERLGEAGRFFSDVAPTVKATE